MADTNQHGIPLSRIDELAAGDEILIGPDFYAEILAVRDGGYLEICTEYGDAMRVHVDAVEAIAKEL